MSHPITLGSTGSDFAFDPLATISQFGKTTAMPTELTDREREVTRLISLGCSDEDAANILGVARSTVNSHRMRAMQKLGVSKTAHLVRMAIKERITSMRDKLTAAEKRKRGRKRDGWN